MTDEPEDREPAAPASEPAAASTATLLVGAVALGVAGAAVLAGGAFLLMNSGLVGGGTPVATRDLAPGEEIGPSDVTRIRTGADLAGLAAEPAGRVVRTHIYAGDPIHEERLASEGKPPGAASLAPSGRRALWLAVDGTVSGLGLQPGDQVDLYATLLEPEKQGYTSRVAEAVDVLHVSAPAPLKPSKATLAATPAVATAIAQAQETGLIGVVLRSARDRVPAEDGGGHGAQPGPTVLTGWNGESRAARAARSIAPGDPIAAEDVLADDGVVGKIPARRILPGEQVLPPVLTAPEQAHGLSALLGAGARAVAVSLGDAPADAFAIGDRLDLASVEHEEPETVAAGVTVVGIQPDGEDCPCIALEVPEAELPDVLRIRAIQALGLVLPEEEE